MRNSSTKKIGWRQVRSTLLCIIAFIMTFCLTFASVLAIKDATMSIRERTKLRLMYMIEHNGWDPFSANMSLEEYFALMELYDEGKLPLKNKKATALAAETEEEDEDDNGDIDSSGSGGPADRLYFPREKFLLAGLDLDFTNYNGKTTPPLPYNSDNRYGPHDPNKYAKTMGEKGDGTQFEYTTNTLERYETLSATFVEIDGDGTEYEVVDGLLCKKNDNEEVFVATEEDHYFEITGLPFGDKDKEGWHYRLTNDVLYLISKNDGTNVEDEDRPNIRIYTPRYYEMGGQTYVFQESELHVHETKDEEDNVVSRDYDRLYNRAYEEKITPYQFAFKDAEGRYYFMNEDVDGSAYPGEGFLVYGMDGTRFALKAGPTDEEGNQIPYLAGQNLTSLSTGNIYTVTDDGGLWEYAEDKEFSENEADYYIVDGKLCEWRRGKLYIEGTAEEFEYNGLASDQFVKELAYYYPEGLETTNADYLRPPRDWLGLMISRDTAEEQVRRVSIVQEKENTGRIAGYVKQDLFGTPVLDKNGNISSFAGDGIQYDKYYIKRVTLDSANVNVLGIIWAEDLGRYVYYYLSAEGQSTQVSTTTLGDDQKFIIEYTNFEYEVSYRVENTEGIDITLVEPKNVVMFGSTKPTELGWLDSIFGVNRPTRTVDGAYSFDVLVPYGYEVRIIIKVTRTIEGGPYTVVRNGQEVTLDNIDYTFDAGIDHTSSRETIMDTWLASYGQYLLDNGIIIDAEIGTTLLERHGNNVVVDDEVITDKLEVFKANYVQVNYDKVDGYSFEWIDKKDPNKKIHDGVFGIIAERVNDVHMHNSALDKPETGFPLGMYPDYSVVNVSQQLPSEKGPATLTFIDNFSNHLVKADREIVAVLKPIGALMFDITGILATNNASGRGSVAKETWAYADEETLVKYYEIAVTGKTEGLPLHSGGAPDNVDSSDGWNWNNAGEFRNKPQPMTDPTNAFYAPGGPNADGSYNYNFMFQTNNSESFYLDVLEINGVAMQIPMRPRYASQVTNYKTPAADNSHPWYTTGTLPDGAKVTVEFWYGWHSSRDQHHYRIRIEGVHTNVTITGFNLMMYDGGAPEFSVYNLVGVYSDLNGETQQQEAIEYYGQKDKDARDQIAWIRATESTMHVAVLNLESNGSIGDGDVQHGGANLRFKIANGYGTPYFIWDTLRKGIAYASVPIDENGIADTTDPYEVRNFSDIETFENGKSKIGTLEDNYIYYDNRQTVDGTPNPDYGYYYIRIDKNNRYGGDNMALLTIVARTVKYTVRYVPYIASVNGTVTLTGDPWEEKPAVTLYNYPVSGYVVDRNDSNILTKMTQSLLADLGDEENGPKLFSLLGTSMPLTEHDWDTCALAATLKDKDGNLPKPGDYNYQFLQILHEYDDYGGSFYDLLQNTRAGIASTETGIVRPRDDTGQFAFVTWVVVDANYEPVTDDDGNYIYFGSGAIDLTEYARYTVKHSAFGDDDMDINVLRLMPVWKANRETTTYRVVLNWVDALGDLHTADYSELWDDIVTEKPENGKLYVFLNQDATALQNWIALHPTYNFWNAVNNATTDTAIKTALDQYVGSLFDLTVDADREAYENIYNALTQQQFIPYATDKDGNFVDANGNVTTDKEKRVKADPTQHTGFSRLGSDVFALDVEALESKEGVTISIWMYENKGGFVFHKEVAEEPFVADDEFYFTVINARSGRKTTTTVNGKETVKYDDVLEGVYKAYPQFVYENDGVTTRPPKDSDAWLVTFDKDGNISQLQRYDSKDNKWKTMNELDENENEIQEDVKDEDGNVIGTRPIPVTYFTLKSGQGIRLYVPNGQYTIVELGSKSGGSYQAHVEYAAEDGSEAPGSWDIQENEVWLKGDTRVTSNGASQVAVTVDFEIGEQNVVQILTFYNQTTSLSLGKTVDTTEEGKEENSSTYKLYNLYKGLTYTLKVTIQLPSYNTGTSGEDVDTSTPLVGYQYVENADGTRTPIEDSKYYYFTANYYTNKYTSVDIGEGHTVETEIVEKIEIEFEKVTPKEGEADLNQWTAEVQIKSGERKVIIMTADYENINYWVQELDNTAERPDVIAGYVYAHGTKDKDLDGNDIVVYNYTYYETLKDAEDAYPKAKVFETPVDDTAKDFTEMDYIQPATLAKMGLTPLISPQEGSAQKGKKDIVSVVNWLGELPGYGYLELTVKATDGVDANDSFVFKIASARGTVLYVTLRAGQTLYIFLQSGMYTIEEVGWGWRYNNDSAVATDPTQGDAPSAVSTSERLTITVSQDNDSRKNAIRAEYTFSPNYKGWLGGETRMDKSYEAIPEEKSDDASSAD